MNHTDQALAVYDAEDTPFYRGATSGASFRTARGMRDLIWEIRQSERFKKRHGDKKVALRIRSRGMTYAYAQRTRQGGLSIIAAEGSRSVHMLVHEMAHHISTSGAHHGPEFVRNLLHMVKEYEGVYYWRKLKKRLKETGAMR